MARAEPRQACLRRRIAERNVGLREVLPVVPETRFRIHPWRGLGGIRQIPVFGEISLPGADAGRKRKGRHMWKTVTAFEGIVFRKLFAGGRRMFYAEAKARREEGCSSVRVGKFRSGFGEQVVVNLQTEGAYNGEIVLDH